MDWTQEITFLAPIVVIGLGIGVAQLKAYQASAAAQKHQTLNYLAGLGVRVGDDAMALLRSTSGLTPAGVLSWAISEFWATAPDAIAALGSDGAAAGIENLVRRGILSSAQGGPLDDAASSVIKALAPSAATAKVSPNQIAAVGAAVSTAAPIAIEDVTAALLARFPGLATLGGDPQPASAGAPSPAIAAVQAALATTKPVGIMP
jgi:hypothetical protein